MAFPDAQTSNWVQHVIIEGRCQRCRLMTTLPVTQTVWMKDGAALTVAPDTRWAPCVAPEAHGGGGRR